MYGKKASELVKEFTTSEPGQLTPFNNDLFSQVVEECNGHILHLQSLLRRMQEEDRPDNQTNKNADHFGALIHHLSLVRNKRCLMAYVYNRAEIIRNLGWAIERVLPEEIQEKLSNSEKEYFKNHSATLQSYMSELDLDLAVTMPLTESEIDLVYCHSIHEAFTKHVSVMSNFEDNIYSRPVCLDKSHKRIIVQYIDFDMIPPKDPYIKVRVLEEIGNVVLSDQVANLAHHAILFLKRTDAEQYISQGLMEELTS